jgi:hypothetical protein
MADAVPETDVRSARPALVSVLRRIRNDMVGRDDQKVIEAAGFESRRFAGSGHLTARDACDMRDWGGNSHARRGGRSAVETAAIGPRQGS